MSDLNVFVIFTYPSISVLGNKIWSGCSVPVIRFLVIILPNGVAINDASSRLYRQVIKYFAVPALIFYARVFGFRSHLVQFFYSRLYPNMYAMEIPEVQRHINVKRKVTDSQGT